MPSMRHRHAQHARQAMANDSTATAHGADHVAPTSMANAKRSNDSTARLDHGAATNPILYSRV